MMTPEQLEEIQDITRDEDIGAWAISTIRDLLAEIVRLQSGSDSQAQTIRRLKEALREARCAAMPESACADEMENVCRGVDEDFPG